MSTDRQVLNFHKSISEIDFCNSTPPQGFIDRSEGEYKGPFSHEKAAKTKEFYIIDYKVAL